MDEVVISRTYTEAKLSHLINAFDCQQTHLTMRAAISMGITNKSIIFFKEPFAYIFFSYALPLTFADGNYLGH